MNISIAVKCLIFVILVAIFLVEGLGDAPQRRRHRRNRNATRRMEFVRRRLASHRLRRRRRPADGKLRLVDGRADWEGNVEIFHDGKWGNICDDEWDLREGQLVCREIGFPDAIKVTYSGHYGHVRHEYWMDNLFCSGEEERLSDCRHDGWGRHDCEVNEAAGVVCETKTITTTPTSDITQAPKDAPEPIKKDIIRVVQRGKIKIRLRGGRIKTEGRIEVKMKGIDSWGLICGDDWSLLEAMVVCKQLGLKYAQSAPSTGYFGGNSSNIILSGVKCNGNEQSLSNCLHDVVKEVECPGPYPNANIAGATCVDKMADLAPDYLELARSAHLEDKQLFYLQCAIEENCLASPAYKQMESGYGWHLVSRRLLRFTARIVNQGDDDFIPILPKSNWEWHQCHMHYHSMEVFAHYDITDANGKRVAEGHKASFCLEDNNCAPGITPVYDCKNFGDQGISPGCTDTYAYNIDCQWVDITELQPGTYTFKLEINPEFKVGEQTFENNAAVCELQYNQQTVWIGNCILTKPGFRHEFIAPNITGVNKFTPQSNINNTVIQSYNSSNENSILNDPSNEIINPGTEPSSDIQDNLNGHQNISESSDIQDNLNGHQDTSEENRQINQTSISEVSDNVTYTYLESESSRPTTPDSINQVLETSSVAIDVNYSSSEAYYLQEISLVNQTDTQVNNEIDTDN